MRRRGAAAKKAPATPTPTATAGEAGEQVEGLGWPPLACVGALCCASYCNTLENEFSFDDNFAVVKNPDVSAEGGGSSLAALLTHDFWGRDMNAENSHKSWRPLTIFTFQLNYLAGGLEPAGFHATNAALHGLVCAAVVQLGRAVSGCLRTSLLGGLAFAAHPVHVEAVTGVVGRADVLGTLLSILAFA